MATKNLTTLCPNCDEEIRFRQQPKLHDAVTCHHCEDVFEVIRVSPIVVDWPEENSDDYDYEEDEEWAYEDDDDDYDQDYDD